MRFHLLLLFALSALPGLTSTAQNLQQFIDDALAQGQTKIVIPPGRWRVKPSDRQHLLLRNLKNVEISAAGAEMICTETTRAITVSNCDNLTVSGLTVDYDPLPFTQGDITAMAPDKSWLEFRLQDGYPENALFPRVQIYDRATRLLKRPTHFGWAPVQPLGNRRYRVGKTKNYRFNPAVDTEQVGDYLVLNNDYNPGGRLPHAILSDRCRNLVLRDVKVYAGNCFTFFETNCDNSSYLNCSIDRRPPQTDLKPRALMRLRSSNADAYHSKFARRGPKIIGCVAAFQGDDAVNICGAYHMIMNASGRTLRVLAKHDFNIAPGDPVELVSYSGVRLPDARAVKITRNGSVTAAEKAFLLRQNMNDSLKHSRHGALTNAYDVELDRAVELPMGSVIAAANRTGNGFQVKNCRFSFNRSRGILIKADNGEVSGNTLTGNWGEAIKVAPEWWWLESGSPRNVKITGNTITDCRAVAIAVYSHGGDGRLSPAGALSGIAVENNRITGCPRPNIVVTSTLGLTLQGNVTASPAKHDMPPWERNRFQLAAPLKEVMTVNCAKVKHDYE